MQNNVIDGALALVNKINEQVRVIERCNITKAHMKDAELFLLSESELQELEGVSEEQMEMIKAYISDVLDANVSEAEEFLQSLQSEKLPCRGDVQEKPNNVPEMAEIVPEIQESASKEAKSVSVDDKEHARKAEEIEHPIKSLDEVQKEAQAAGMSYGQYVQQTGSCTGATRKMTVGDLEAELAAGLTIASIARKYGYSNASSIINAISKHNIDVKGITNGQSPYRLTEEDIPRIRELYTDGDKNLTETASRLGVTKKTLKAFVDENHLTKRLR